MYEMTTKYVLLLLCRETQILAFKNLIIHWKKIWNITCISIIYYINNVELDLKPLFALTREVTELVLLALLLI